MQNKKIFTCSLICAIVCTLSFDVFADIVKLNNGSSIRGYIISKSESFCLLQTSLGTMNLSLSDISDIEYQSPEENLTFLASEYMDDNKFKEAIDYYCQALNENPDYKPALNGLKRAQKELKKSQRLLEELKEKNIIKKEKIKERILDIYGIELEIGESGLRVERVLPDSKAAAGGLERQDVICAINSKNLLKLQEDEILELLETEYSNVESVCFYRKYVLEPTEIKYRFKKQKVLGIVLVEKGRSIEVDEIIKNSSADVAGLEEKDKIKQINGESVKDKSLKEIATMTMNSEKVDLLILRCLR
jgi:C-terminal processing protease CtpA/Prc